MLFNQVNGYMVGKGRGKDERKILSAIDKNSKQPQDLAIMLGYSEEEISNTLKELEERAYYMWISNLD